MKLIAVTDVEQEQHTPFAQTLELATGETLAVISCATCGRITAHLPGQRFYVLESGNFWANHRPEKSITMNKRQPDEGQADKETR